MDRILKSGAYLGAFFVDLAEAIGTCVKSMPGGRRQRLLRFFLALLLAGKLLSNAETGKRGCSLNQ